MFYLTTHSTHFIYGYMASDIWLRTVLIVRKKTRCRHIGYSYQLTARVLLYAPSHRQDNTYHSLCYTSRGALAGMRNSSMGPPHEGSIRWPIAPWANALPLSYVPLPRTHWNDNSFCFLQMLLYIRSHISRIVPDPSVIKLRCYFTFTFEYWVQHKWSLIADFGCDMSLCGTWNKTQEAS